MKRKRSFEVKAKETEFLVEENVSKPYTKDTLNLKIPTSDAVKYKSSDLLRSTMTMNSTNTGRNVLSILCVSKMSTNPYVKNKWRNY